jgi:hypothetical protein
MMSLTDRSDIAVLDVRAMCQALGLSLPA